MRPEDFVKKIIQSVINKNNETYRSLFDETKLNEVNEEYWINALHFYNSLSHENKEVLLSIIKQITVDTVSNIFGIIDGSSSLDGKFEDFTLLYNNNGQKLNGDLQDILLQQE